MLTSIILCISMAVVAPLNIYPASFPCKTRRNTVNTDEFAIYGLVNFLNGNVTSVLDILGIKFVSFISLKHNEESTKGS